MPVSLPSYRVLSFVVVYGIRVCANELWVVVRSARAPPKNQRRLRRTGPPTVASNVGEYLLALEVPADCSNGVSTLHAGLVRFVRNAPDRTLPPLRVMTFTIPPLKRPYSAEMPDVSTWTSWIASSMNRLFGVPSTLSLMSTPFMRNRLSYANEPEIVTCDALGVLSVNPGVSSAIRNGVRPTGSCRSSETCRFAVPCEVTADGVAPRTSTDSLTGASVNR